MRLLAKYRAVTFEQILLIYIYQHKKVALQEFGTITLTEQLPDAEMIKKDRAMPVQGLEFKHLPSVQTDPEFITFYAEQKGRIRPLAASDIDMYLLQAKQIVNIGNPFEIAGLGKIIKNDDGSLRMVPGYYTIPLAVGTNKPPTLRERVQTPVLPAAGADGDKPARVSKKQLSQAVILGGAALLIALFVWAIIRFVVPMFGSPAADSTTDTEAVVQPDTSGANSTALTPGPITGADSTMAADTTAITLWKAYLRNKKTLEEVQKAQLRYKSYGMNTNIETADSITYNLYITIHAAAKDTAYKRDSLRKWYARPVKLVPMNK